MNKQTLVKKAMEYNRCAIFARRVGDITATVEAFTSRRDYFMKLARS